MHNIVAGILGVETALVGGAEGVFGDAYFLQNIVFVEFALDLIALRSDVFLVVAVLSATLSVVFCDLGVTYLQLSDVTVISGDVALLPE